MVKEKKEKNFTEEISKVRGKVLVDFWASWCGPCRMLSPIMEEIGKDNTVFKVDVDENMSLSEEFGIFSIPCVLVFENGKEVNRSVGLKTKEEMEELLNE